MISMSRNELIRTQREYLLGRILGTSQRSASSKMTQRPLSLTVTPLCSCSSGATKASLHTQQNTAEVMVWDSEFNCKDTVTSSTLCPLALSPSLFPPQITHSEGNQLLWSTEETMKRPAERTLWR